MDALKRIGSSFTILGIVFFIGLAGFRIVGDGNPSMVDCAYMAIITLTTVGYGEAVALTSDIAKLFGALYAIMGMGVLLYVIATVTAFIVEGDARRILIERRTRKMVEKLQDHYIICGIGRQGLVIVQEFHKALRPFVMIEGNAERVRELQSEFPNVPVVEGDATDEAILVKAGIHKAAGLVCCLHEDRDNLLLVVTAKQARADIRIVCKVMEIQDMVKLQRAGADTVVSPTLIGGLRMASEMIRPSVVSFLDIMLRDKDKTLRVEEVVVPVESKAAGKTLADLDVTHNAGLVVVAIMRPGAEKFDYAPTGDLQIQEGMVLVVVGQVTNLPKLKSLVD